MTLAQNEPLRFVGLDNYERLLNDSQVWESLAVTFRFAALWLPFVVVVPFVLALALNSQYTRARACSGRCSSCPTSCRSSPACSSGSRCSATPAGSTTSCGSLGWQDPPVWLFDISWIYPALVIMGVWGIGAGVIINLAGLRGIPTELYDAAKIDGANGRQQLRFVTIPMMSPVIFYTLILGVVGVLQYFLVPLVLKNGTGEPGGSTLFYNLYLYKTFFNFQQMSYGATLAWLLFGIALLFTVVLFRLSRRWVYYAGER